MRAPLAVVITIDRVRRQITGHVRDLTFSKVAPGGHQQATLTLVGIALSELEQLDPADRVWIYDGRTGQTLWEGYTELPSRSRGADADGEAVTVEALGAMTQAGEESRPLVYVDRELDGWSKYENSPANAEVSTGPNSEADDVPGVLMQYRPGSPVRPVLAADPITQGFGVDYTRVADAGMELGTLRLTLRSGRSQTGWIVDLIAQGRVASPLITLTSPITTTAVTFNRAVGMGALHPNIGTDRVRVRFRRSGKATNVATDDVWCFIYDIVMCGSRMDRTGRLLTGAEQADQANTHVRADWVVEDLVGRLLPCDPAGVSIAATTTAIEQLAYPDGTTARQVLDDLALYEPDMLWELLDSTTTGRHRFTYRPWPTSVRYEVTTADGYDSPGTETDLCNRVAVYWSDADGKKRTTIVTSDVPELGTRRRDAEPVTLPEGLGTEADAQRIGGQILAAKSKPSKAATVTVRRPILDKLTGRVVMPWELEPGYLAAVRETGDVLRITETTYTDAECSTQLTLGEPALTVEQRLTALSQKGARQ